MTLAVLLRALLFRERGSGVNSDEIHQSLCHTCCELVSLWTYLHRMWSLVHDLGNNWSLSQTETTRACPEMYFLDRICWVGETFFMFIFRNKQTNYPEDEPASTVKQIRRQCIWSFLVENISGWISQWWMTDENVSVMSRRGRSTSSRTRFQLSRLSIDARLVRSRGTPSIYLTLEQ